MTEAFLSDFSLTPSPTSASIVPTFPARLTLIAQLQVQQGVDTAHSFLAGSHHCVSTPRGKETDKETQVVEGYQCLQGDKR